MIANTAHAHPRTRAPSEPHGGVATTYCLACFRPPITYVVADVVAQGGSK